MVQPDGIWDYQHSGHALFALTATMRFLYSLLEGGAGKEHGQEVKREEIHFSYFVNIWDIPSSCYSHLQ